MPRLAPALFLTALWGAGCATPALPSGGPVDTTPPALVASTPETGAVGVTGRTVRLAFSERLDTGGRTAVTVAPEGDAPARVRIENDEVVVTLPALRDSTTYVVTVGTALKDDRGVALRAPVTVAFSTGDAIDAGRVAGVVRSPETGRGAALAVWAYALADSSAAATDRAPDYRTETGEDGAFVLEYLRPGPYLVVAAADRNRNGRLDPGERFAPPPRRALRADTADAEPAVFWTTTRDAAPPRAQRVRPISDRRLAVRFDEPVVLADPSGAGWTVADSLSGRTVPVTAYQPEGSPFEVVLQTEAALRPVPHRVAFAPQDPPALADSSGAAPAPFALAFTPPARADTVRARFVAFEPGAPTDSVTVLRPGAVPAVRFSSPPADPAARLALTASGGPVPVAFASADGVTLRPVLADSAALPPRFTLSVATPDTTVQRRYAVAGERETGALVGRVTADGPARVEARPASGDPVTVRVGADGAYTVGGLLPGPYTLRVWVDRDGDGRWSGGAVAPYVAPEPLRLVTEPVQVRARWETEVPPITL